MGRSCDWSYYPGLEQNFYHFSQCPSLKLAPSSQNRFRRSHGSDLLISLLRWEHVTKRRVSLPMLYLWDPLKCPWQGVYRLPGRLWANKGRAGPLDLGHSDTNWQKTEICIAAWEALLPKRAFLSPFTSAQEASWSEASSHLLLFLFYSS